VEKNEIEVDLFANHFNKQAKLYCTRSCNAFWFHLGQLGVILWANPPWSQLYRVLTKIILDRAKVVLVTPFWPNTYWHRLLEKITSRCGRIQQGKACYLGDWDKVPLPSPPWETKISLVDGSLWEEDTLVLDPKVVSWIQRKNKGWGRVELIDQMTKSYPIFPDERISWENEVVEKLELPETPKGKSLPSEFPSPDTPFSKATTSHLEKDQALWLQIESTFDLMAECTTLLDLSFQEKGWKSEVRHVDDSLLRLDTTNDPEDLKSTNSFAKPSSLFPINRQDLQELSQKVHQRIFELESQMSSQEPTPQMGKQPFELEHTENLVGDFEKEVSRFKDNPPLYALLVK